MRKIWLSVLTLSAWAIASTSFADELTSEAAAERLFSAEELKLEWFADSALFHDAEFIAKKLKAELGPFKSVIGCVEKCVIGFERGEASIEILLNEVGGISHLWFDSLTSYLSIDRDAPPETVATRLFRAERIRPEWFRDNLFRSVIGRIEVIREMLGKFQFVSPCTTRCIAVFERGEAPFDFQVNTDGVITRLSIDAPVIFAPSLNDAVGRFRQLPGRISLFVSRNSDELVDFDSRTPLAVGPAFQLAVLKALQNLIGAGKLDWDQTVEIKENWRSIPNGQIHNWPIGAPITLHTLATLMVTTKDNTATDALIDIVTRNSIEMISPANRPFLTTREFFNLRGKNRVDLRTSFLASSYDQRWELLQSSEIRQVPRLSDLVWEPLLDIDWRYSTHELCKFMEDLRDLDLVQINQGYAGFQNSSSVAFVSGGNPGVRNRTTHLTTEDGTSYCISATWNHDQQLNEKDFINLYTGVLHHLK